MFFVCRLVERKSFFYANYFNWSLTSPVILDHTSHMIRIPLLSQAKHAIRQKSRSTGIVLTGFPWILEVNASKEEKKSL